MKPQENGKFDRSGKGAICPAEESRVTASVTGMTRGRRILCHGCGGIQSNPQNRDLEALVQGMNSQMLDIERRMDV